jgi:hypothetical protein
LIRSEWLKARRGGVSGTDISILMGANPYKNENSLLMEKLGIQGAKAEFTGNKTTRIGTRLEPLVANYWAIREQRIITDGKFCRDQYNNRFIGTPDFLCYDQGLEIKTAGEHIHAKGCPKYQEFQCRWYAMITERDKWHLEACLVPRNRDEVPEQESDEYLYEWVKNRPHRGYDFHRDSHLELEMRQRASEFLEKLDALAVKTEGGLDSLRSSFGSWSEFGPAS